MHNKREKSQGGKDRQISRTMHERKDYRGFLLNPTHFALNIVGPRPATKVRNERRWRLCSAPTLQPSTLSHWQNETVNRVAWCGLKMTEF